MAGIVPGTPDADPIEMEIPSNVSDREIEQLMAGKAPSGPSGLDDLAGFVRDLRTSCAAEPSSALMSRHVARAVQTTLDANRAGLRPRPARFSRLARRPKPRRVTWRRRTVFSSMFASLTAKIAGVALAAGVATTGALAASGALPGPAQAAASHVAASVGISLPDRDGHAGNENEEGMGVTPTVTATVTPTVSPTPEESDSPEATPGDEAAEQNHGSCVSFAAHAADVLGLHGAQHGAFVSMVAGDPSAVSARVTQGGLPDAACLSALAKAKAAVAGMTTTPTSTATDDVTAGGNEGKDEGHGKGDQDPAPAITPMSRLILPTGHGDQDHGGKDKPGDFSGLTTQTGSGS